MTTLVRGTYTNISIDPYPPMDHQHQSLAETDYHPSLSNFFDFSILQRRNM